MSDELNNNGTKPDENNDENPDNVVVDGSSDTTSDEMDEVINIDGNDYKVDTNGNALDAEGKVFKTKDELSVLTQVTDTVKFGDIEYKKDNEGNLLDDEGKIVYTKDEIADIEIPYSIINLMEKTGIKPVDGNGNRIIYDNTPDGHIAYINDISNIRAQQTVTKQFSKFLTDNPDIAAVIRHKNTYGNIDNYSPKTDYTMLDIENADEATQINVILTARIKRGDTPEKVQKYIEYLKKEGTLKEESKVEHEFIKKEEFEIAKQREALKIKQLSDKQREDNIYWSKVKTTIDKGMIKVDNIEYKIPKIFSIEVDGKKTTATSEDFFAYLYQPIVVRDANGVERKTTRYQLDEDNFYKRNGIDAEIYNALSLFIKKPTKFIEEQIKTRQTKQVKKYVSTPNGNKTQTNAVTKKDGKIDYNREI